MRAEPRHSSTNESGEHCTVLPVDSWAYKYWPPAANNPTDPAHNGHRHPLEDNLGGGQEHEIVVGQGRIVSGGAHVGGQVGVDVWITEVKDQLFLNFHKK